MLTDATPSTLLALAAPPPMPTVSATHAADEAARGQAAAQREAQAQREAAAKREFRIDIDFGAGEVKVEEE